MLNRRYVCLKGYGDLVALISSLKHFYNVQQQRPKYLLSSHLQPLYAELSGDNDVIYIDSSGELPPMYSIREKGILAGIRSMLSIRGQLVDLCRQSDEHILDMVGARESFLFREYQLCSVACGQSNLYLSYAHFLGFDPSNFLLQNSLCSQLPAFEVGIFPNSRYRKKDMPPHVFFALVEAIRSFGAEPVLFLMDGQSLSFDHGFAARLVCVQRKFSSLIDAVNSVSSVVSVDSLPAHLGELLRRPVFVVTPVDNRYFLPPNAYFKGYWETFKNFSAEHHGFTDFLRSVSK